MTDFAGNGYEFILYLNADDLGGYVKEIFGLSSNGQFMKEESESLGGMGKRIGMLTDEIKSGVYGKSGKAYDEANGLLNAAKKQYDQIINAVDSAKKQASNLE